MLAGFSTLQQPPASHEELCSRLESVLLDISDLALPARLLKDAEALLGDWFAAERSRVERSAAPALYRAIETLSRLTSIRRTLIGLAKALMEPPRPPAPKPDPSNPAKPNFAQDASSFVVPPLGDPGEDEKLAAAETREPDPANPTAPDPDQNARPIGLPKLSLTAVLAPEPSPRSELRPPPWDAPVPSPGSAPSPTPQPKRGPLVRSSAEIVSQVRSCPRLATLSQKLLTRHFHLAMDFGIALKMARMAREPGQTNPALSGYDLPIQKYSFHPMPLPEQPSPAPPDSTAGPPDSG